ncbi:MAG: HNH endonuclease [Proteobacteria bacterium]|nr:HNH endonuclease [Pseudomonadota bacterium]
MSLAASDCPVLVLNADFRPLSYFPLSIWSWQDALKAVFLKRVNVVSEYERRVRSPSAEFRVPSVISLKTYVPHARYPAFTRFNVFLRDRFDCQYCGGRFEPRDLTFDHVVPRSLGGRTTWSNVVTACLDCNLKKGNRLPRAARLFPLRLPREPTTFELQDNGRAFPPDELHESWRDYLYWDSELDAD